MIAALTWLGRHARWLLALGCVVALFVPQASSALRPFLPWFVSLVLGLSMARIDLLDIGAKLLTARFLSRVGLVALAVMPLTGVVYLGLGLVLDLNALDRASLIYLAASPPIASAAGVCFLLGFNARLALEITLAGTVLTPIVGPLMVALMIPDAAAISSLDLAYRLAAMIAFGVAIGAGIQMVVGQARIAAHPDVFNGAAAVGMVLFVLPVFDGVLATIQSDPGAALRVFALAMLFNIGVNLVVYAGLFRQPPADRGALGLVWGNRTVALYLAALPPDAQFSMFVALYQFPMYFTPLIMARLAVRPVPPP